MKKKNTLNLQAIKWYLTIVFTLNWGYALIFYVLGGRLTTIAGLIFSILYMFGPLIAAIITQKYILKQPLREPLTIRFKPNRWFLPAILIPFIISIGAFGIALLIPGIKFTPGMEGMIERYGKMLTPAQIQQMRQQMNAFPIHPYFLTMLEGLIAGISINALAAFGEELGWRGFLLKELKPLGFWKASALIGLIWGIWHAPFIIQGYNYPQHPQLGVLLMMLFCLLYTPLMVFVTLKAKSVIAAAIFHGTINATPGLAILLIQGGNDLTVGIMGIAGFISLGIGNAVLFAILKRYPLKLSSS